MMNAIPLVYIHGPTRTQVQTIFWYRASVSIFVAPSAVKPSWEHSGRGKALRLGS